MLLSLARFFSLIGHPLLVLTYALLVMLLAAPYEFGVYAWSHPKALTLMAYVVSSTILIPGVGIVLMKPLGFISNLQSPDRLERIGPYILAGVFYLWLYQNLRAGAQVPELYRTCILGATLTLFGVFFVNVFTKVSAHTAGMGGWVAMLLLLAVEWPTRPVRLEIGGYWLHVSPVLLLAQGVILAGAVGWARLMLGVHTPRQVWYGYAIGFTGALAAWWAAGR